MSNKKHIDRLFQEKFKDFEASPPKRVWKNIEQELKKDKKRRVIPLLWYKTAGLAAAIALLIFLGNTFFLSDKIEVVNTIHPEKGNFKKNSNNSIENSVKENLNAEKEFSNQKNKFKTNNQLVENTSTSSKENNNQNKLDEYNQHEQDKNEKIYLNNEKSNVTIAHTNNASAEAKTQNNHAGITKKTNNEIDYPKEISSQTNNSNLAVTKVIKDSTLTKENLTFLFYQKFYTRK